jgi:hypothetical protein
MRIISGIITCVLCCSLLTETGAAAGNDSTAGIQCIASLASWRAGEALQRAAWEGIRDWSRARGVPILDKADWAVWIDASYAVESDSNEVILSVGIAHTLPEEAMEAGKRAEVFYSYLTPEHRAKLPKEGKWVRELMTQEFLLQFVMPIDHRIVLVQRRDVPARLSSLLDELTRNRIKKRNG